MKLRMTHGKAGGFTLIELLIVVAIIAILAAIAVPNFLEAQTRSKVSRAKTDVRTIATGMEAYFVDHNAYPPRPDGWIYPLRFIPLTTPVAYLTSIPEDPFKLTAGAFNTGGDGASTDASYDYFARSWTDNVDWLHLVFLGFEDRAKYLLASIGPDLRWWGVNNVFGVVYNPTNGTRSEGEIVYVGPGFGFPGQE
ncbi:MAG TPA: prepilin-type N-terminal cleavage/methylation domain-containing protein [Sumerlaeia bacterium]|nr:prepilin-type N-terminal cleavage/methylation domain-containing protein [Sumerlaeia bacterium]